MSAAERKRELIKAGGLLLSQIPQKPLILITHGGITKKELSSLRTRLKPVGAHDILLAGRGKGLSFRYSWIVPVLILIIGKGLLDGFLKELGAQGAKSLQNILKQILQKQQNRFTTIFPNGIPINEPRPLMALSLHLGIGTALVNFDFPLGLSNDELASALESIPDMVTKAKDLCTKRGKRSGTIQFKFTNNEWKLIRKRRKSKAKPNRKL